jgi:hypothetical protein
MRGRYVIKLSFALFTKIHDLNEIPGQTPDCNIAPTSSVPPSHKGADGSRRLSLLR